MKRQETAAEKAGVGVTTWRELEAGRPPERRPLRAAIALALNWPPDALDRIADGDESFIGTGTNDERLDVIESRLSHVEAAIEQIATTIEQWPAAP